MKKIKKITPSAFRTILSVTFFIISARIGYRLLIKGILPPPEFITFFIAVSFISLCIILLPQLQELSIAGSSIKLREITNSAEEALKNLQSAQLINYKLLIKNSMNSSIGADSVSVVDPRVDILQMLYTNLKHTDFYDEIKNELHEFSRFVLYQQVFCINKNTRIKVVDIKNTPLTPHQVKLSAFEDEKLLEASQRTVNSRKTIDTCRENTIYSTDCYSKIYDIFKKTE